MLKIARGISIAATCLSSSATALAQEIPQRELQVLGAKTINRDLQPASRLCYKITTRIDVTLAPTSDLYPSYIADPRYPRFSLNIMSMIHQSIAQTTKSRVSTAVGGSLGVFRIHPDDRPNCGFQFQLGAGGFAQWEGKGRDGIGWDGVYHVLGTFAVDRQWAFKVGTTHVSSHIMDEYIENTGRRRIGYTREEIVAGMSSSPADHWRAYVEGGYAYLVRSAAQKRLRFQAGLEYKSASVLWNGLAGFYMALDTQAYEEDAWNISMALQGGIVIPRDYVGRTLRMGLEFYHGRSPMGEFFQDSESQISLGWWLDL